MSMRFHRTEPSEREWLEGLRYEDKFPPKREKCAGCGRPNGFYGPRDFCSFTCAVEAARTQTAREARA